MNARKEKLDPEFLLCCPRYLSPLGSQQEKSMLGQRTRFLLLHRYIDGLTVEKLDAALKAVNALHAQYNKSNPTETFTDINILTDVLHHEIGLRDGYSFEQLHDIKKSYLFYVNVAESFPDITSEHMINLIEKNIN